MPSQDLLRRKARACLGGPGTDPNLGSAGKQDGSAAREDTGMTGAAG
jgi:hypothetical protein